MWFERDRAAAEDAVQETMLQALRSFHRFQPGTNCRAWLVTILQHVISNRRRQVRRSLIVDVDNLEERIAETVPFVPAPPEDLTDEDVLSAVAKLPLPFQQVIVLCDVEELSYKQIAEALSIPLGTVMSRLHRGRALLRTQLAGIGESLGLVGTGT